MHKRSFLKTTVALATLAWGAAHAADTPLKFQLDWRFKAPLPCLSTLSKKAISSRRAWM